MARKKRRRGEGSQWPLKSGSWRAEVPLGHGETVTQVFPSEREATKWRVATCAARDAGTFAKPTADTVDSWLDRWLAQKAGSTEAATHAFYAAKADRHVRPHLGKLKLSAVKPATVADWYANLTRAGVSASEQRRAGRTLRTAFEDALRQQLIPVNHAKAVKMPRAADAEAFALSLAEARKLIAAAAGGPWEAFVRFGLDSGLRPQEVAALQWGDVDLAGGSVEVRRAIAWVAGKPAAEKATKTRKGRRRVLLAPATVAVMKMLSHGDPKGLVFPNPRTTTWLTRRAMADTVLGPLCERAGVPRATAKTLRHTSATLLLQAGANLKAVSERLGHEDPAMTLRIYQHVMPSMQETVAAISQTLFG